MTSELEEDICPVVGFEGLYAVTNSGRIFNSRTGQEKAAVRKPDGYLTMLLWKENKPKCVRIHRIVYIAFRGPILRGTEINHLDGNKANNSLENLECVTRSKNMQHAMDRGMYPIGEKHPYAKLTRAQVVEVRERRGRGETLRSIAESCNINRYSVHGIVYGRTWRRVSGGPEASVVRVVGG